MKDELERIARLHTINVLKECAVQTHTDWEKYVQTSEKKAMSAIQNYCEQKCREARISMANEIYSEYATQFGDTTVFNSTLQAWLRSFVVAENISGKRLSELQTTSEGGK